MANDLSALSAWIGELTEHFDERQRRILTRKISQAVKKNWAKRIRNQQNPNGARFAPRRNRNRGAMFRHAPRMLKTAYNADKAEIGFDGRYAKIMEVHQYGQTIQPSDNARATTYDVRETVGFSVEDEETIQKIVNEVFLNI